LALISAIILFASAGRSATVTGTVKGVDGAPFQGAFVMAQNTKTKITVNVLSDSQGHYRVEKLPAGDYKVSIRAVGFTAAPQTGVSLTADQNTSFDFALQKGTIHWNEISFYQGMQLFPEAKGKALIQQHCGTCHLFQSRFASVTRDQDGWRDRVEYMRTSMKVGLKDQEADDIASYLATLFGPDTVLPKSPSDMPKFKDTVRTFGNDSTNIVYVEYDMPGPSRMPFSAAPDKDGNLWIPNFGRANKISKLDPKTGEMTDFSAPNIGTAAIHSAVPAADGSVWLTEQASNKLGRWDPVSQKITEYPDTFTPAAKPGTAGEIGGMNHAAAAAEGGEFGSKHTVRMDVKGRAWASGGPLTMFDPETGKYTRFEDYSNTYDVKPAKNGDVWFTAPRLNIVARVDGNTLKITKWTIPTPKSFPRRMEIAPDGSVWIGEFDTGKFARFDPKTETFKEYVLPGPDPTPYSMGFDADGYLWYDSHHMDTVNRFDTKTGKVIEYPFPHAEACMREFFLDAQGRMWYGSNPNNKVGYFYVTGKNGSTMTSSK
jgi:virginiamycin B lyase